jgi:hydroxycarboxylate dehydrogenase B
MHTDDPPPIDAQALTDFAARLLVAGGFRDGESRICAAALVRADLAGVASHGVTRVPEYVYALRKGELTAGAVPEVLRAGPAFCAMDGRYALGQVAMRALLETLVPKARAAGVASGTLARCGHIGRLADWVADAAGSGLAAMLLAQDNGVFTCVAPPGGRAAVTSTNPVAFAVPLGDGRAPFVLDMSTSAASINAMRLAHTAGQRAPDGTVQDAAGRATDDPGVLWADPPGALRPMGGAAHGHRGFGLAMVVDMLAAGLAGGLCPPAPPGTTMAQSVHLTLWDPEAFSGLAHMAAQAQAYMAHIRATPPTDPGAPIRLPGDRARATAQRQAREGIALPPPVRARLSRLAAKLGVAPPPGCAFP